MVGVIKHESYKICCWHLIYYLLIESDVCFHELQQFKKKAYTEKTLKEL